MDKMAKVRSCIFQSSKTTHNLNTIDSLEGSANSTDVSAEMDSSANQNDFLEESLSLPRIHSESEISDDDTDFSQEDAMRLYLEWVSSQHKDIVKMIAIIIMDVLRIRFLLTDVAAATEASLIAVLMRKPFVNGAMNFTMAMVTFQNQKVASTIVHMFLMMRFAEKKLCPGFTAMHTKRKCL